jgi:SWI/SNF-related matrix-associated actin-dependent regulator 1 of chromatin subfamily A
MRRLTGIAKVPMVIEHIDKILHEDIYKKIILFAHHQEVITELFDNLGEYGPAVIRGESSENMRTAAVERFQNNPYCRLFIGSIGAASVGLTLTASSHVVFAEPSWSPKDMAQAEDRAHRIGQKESVLVEILVFDESLDANIMKKVVKKMRVVNEALDVK